MQQNHLLLQYNFKLYRYKYTTKQGNNDLVVRELRLWSEGSWFESKSQQVMTETPLNNVKYWTNYSPGAETKAAHHVLTAAP